MRYTTDAGKRPLLSTLRTTFLLASLLWTPCSALAQDAQWQWKDEGGRERITIDLATAVPSTAPLQVKRNGLHSVLVPAQGGTAGFALQGQAPSAQSLVGNISQGDGGLEVQLKNSAFGFLVTQPSANQIIIDVFSDPLGARWRADGSLAPVGTKAQSKTVPAPVPKNPVAEPPSQSAPASSSKSSDTSESTNVEQVSPEAAVEVVPVQDSTVAATVAATVPASQDAASQGAASARDEEKAQSAKAVQETSAAEQERVAPSDNKEEQKTLATAQSDIASRASEAKAPDAKDQATKPQETTASEATASEATTSEATTSGASASDDATTKTMSDTDSTLVPEAGQSLADEAKPTDEAAEPIDTGEAVATVEPVETGESVETGETKERATIISPQQVQSSVNFSGPEYWPEEEGIATSLSGDATSASVSGGSIGAGNVSGAGAGASTESASASSAALEGASSGADAENAEAQQGMDVVQSIDPATKPETAEVAVEERPVIYQDEEGNEVPKPPVLEDVYAEAMKLMNEAKYKDALPLLEQLLTMPDMKPEMREQVLYYRSDAVDAIYTGKPFEGFEDIVQATNEAMNANLRSTRVPDALRRLGMANLNVGNIAEAEGYFRALRRRYPYDSGVPVDFHSLGKAKMGKGLFAEAEEIFRDILQEYPDSPAVKDGTISLVQALAGQKKYDEALVYADFADKRWARYYIDAPDYLLTLADIDYNLGKKNAALQKYWLLYNLLPTDENSPNVLTRIGDLYFELQHPSSALEVFTDVYERFTDTDAGALALLRLSEKGRFDSPVNMPEMFGVFENPGEPLPQVTYQDLYAQRPTDARSITALLKYALWQLWDKQYAESMGTAADFIDLYPENPDVEVARDVIMRGFMADLKNSLLEENYGRILTLWNGFPLVRERYGDIDPDLRNALARGYLERGEDTKAMELFAEFLQTPKHPQYSDPTFALYFNKYLETGNWNAMLDLGELVKDWDMTPAMRGQLDYAMALSAENLGLRTRSLALWKELENNTDIPKYQRAYATYFLAKDAEERKDIKDAYAYNLKTLELFDELKQERSDRADEGRRKEAMGSLMDITEVANRIPEALEWVERYNQFVDDTSPEYPGLRFREARLYRKLGNNEKAKQLLEVIVAGYADSPFAAAASTELATFEVSRDLQNFIPQNR